ncbi:MAG: glycosyltransferase, partial [Gammaproteobacteria bacterium]
VGLLFWELSRVPKAWLPAISMFDAIMVCSHFIRQAIEDALPAIPVLYAEHPLLMNFTSGQSHEIRGRLNIPAETFVCTSSFDLRSDFARKNPQATLRTFQLAFRNQENVRLLVKINKLERKSLSNVARDLLDELDTDNRVTLISDTISYEDVMRFYAICDVYISLHRAEGLGLGPMEAMMLGKYVIATGYSGNMTFMNDGNSAPVPFTLIEPIKSSWQYLRAFAGPEARWAEPDVEAAAVALRWAYQNPELRERVAATGRRDIAARQAQAWTAPYLESLVEILSDSDRPRARPKHLRQMRLVEILDPTLRRLNIAAFRETLTNRFR